MKKIMDKALEDVDEIGHLLKTKYKKNSKKVYIIVEGQDDKIYYSNFIQDYLPDDWDYEFFIPNKSTNKKSCKKKLLQCYTNIDWRTYNKNQVIFFIDRDLSDILGERLPNQPNIYITDGYAIENSIIKENILLRVITELCYFNECSEGDIKNLKKLYADSFNFFYNTMAIVMGWIIYWQLQGLNPQLGNIEIKKIFKFDDNGNIFLENNINHEYFHNKMNIIYDNKVNIKQYIKIFEKFDKHKMLIRGKYLLEFFIEFCHFIDAKFVNLNCLNITKRIRKRTQPKLSFIDIAHIAKKPKSLATFFDQNIVQYIEKFSTV